MPQAFATFIPSLEGAWWEIFRRDHACAGARSRARWNRFGSTSMSPPPAGISARCKSAVQGLLAMHAVAYLNTDRAVLDHSDIYLAGGQAHVWARIG
jgi:hypothetical protein